MSLRVERANKPIFILGSGRLSLKNVTERLSALVACRPTSAKERIGLLTWPLSMGSIKKVVLARTTEL